MRIIIILLCLFLAGCEKSEVIHSHGMELSAEAVTSLQKKAEGGDAVSAWKLYKYYSYEVHDEPLSEKWLKVAATLKHPPAQRWLAYMIKEYNYSPKTFGETPPAAVLSLLEQSCQTEGDACFELASAYADGYFGKTDQTKARLYFLRGSNLNNRMCWEKISDYYRRGLGGPLDYPGAYYWISLEARCVDPRSVSGKETWTHREEIATHLSRSQLEEEWKRIDSFISQVYDKKVSIDSAPFLAGAIDPKLEAEGRKLSQEKEEKHRTELKTKKT